MTFWRLLVAALIVSFSIAAASRWLESREAVGVLGVGCVLAGIVARSWWTPPTVAVGAWADVLILQFTDAQARTALLIAVATGVPLLAAIIGTLLAKWIERRAGSARTPATRGERPLTVFAAAGLFAALAAVSATG